MTLVKWTVRAADKTVLAYSSRSVSNIQRLNLILEAENDSANRYKLSKQADV